MRQTNPLVHLLDQSTDMVLTVAKVTTLDKVLELPSAESTSRVTELERPQEVGGLLEVGSNSVDLVNQILHTDNAKLAQVLFDDLVVGDWDALLVDLAVAALVDQLADVLERRISVGDVWLDDLKHLAGGLSQPDEDAIVDL